MKAITNIRQHNRSSDDPNTGITIATLFPFGDVLVPIGSNNGLTYTI